MSCYDMTCHSLRSSCGACRHARRAKPPCRPSAPPTTGALPHKRSPNSHSQAQLPLPQEKGLQTPTPTRNSFKAKNSYFQPLQPPTLSSAHARHRAGPGLPASGLCRLRGGCAPHSTRPGCRRSAGLFFIIRACVLVSFAYL